MQPQILNDTEVHRQHVRLKIPVQVDLDGVRYQVDDWSIGGFGVESVMTSRQTGERFVVRMIFPFEEFEMSMRLDARMVYADHDHGRFGCALLGLSKEQMAVFRYLVDAYLSGEVVSAGDLLQIRASDAPARLRPRVDEFDPDDRLAARGSRGTLRRIALSLVGLALIGLIALGVFQRFWVMTLDDAFVDAPIREIRAPTDGPFLALVTRGEGVLDGDLLGTIQTADGDSRPVISPCDCVVVERLIGDGEAARVGDPLIALIRAGEVPVVRAQLSLDEVERLEVGDRVEIRIPGRRQTMSGEIARIDLQPRLDELRRSDAAFAISRRQAQVIVRPDRPLVPEDVGVLARLRFL
ncbi:MAG: HlyD family secretion protein [Geminicoccaceae bacterium]|nr:HlyD family secretion protein [Geminicoccaceae bacterium]